MKGTPGREVCQYEECDGVVKAFGWCGKHWRRVQTHGTPDPVTPTREERFWGKVDASGDCWVWTAGSQRGYGVFATAPGRSGKAHRVAYEYLIGPVPEGMTLDHLCKNTLCVNLDHLEPVTAGENSRRSDSLVVRRGRWTHCQRGHEFTPENTGRDTRDGSRFCRECIRMRRRVGWKAAK